MEYSLLGWFPGNWMGDFVKTPTYPQRNLSWAYYEYDFAHPTPHHPTQELYSRSGVISRLCKLTQYKLKLSLNLKLGKT